MPSKRHYRSDTVTMTSDSSTPKKVLDLAYDTYHLSARGYYKIIKVARTIADMESSGEIRREHVLEAIGYRNPLAER